MPKESVHTTLCHAFPIRMTTHCSTMHSHDFHELYLALDEGGLQHSDSASITMNEGDIFFFPAHLPHVGASPRDRSVDALVVHFSDAMFSKSSPGDKDAIHVLEKVSLQSRANSFRVVDGTSGDDFRWIFQDLVRESRQKQPAFISSMKALLTTFLCALPRNGHLKMPANELQPVDNQERIWEVCRFIESNSTMQLTVDHSAEMANMSRSHFQALFRKYTGKTFTEFLNGVRARHALELLQTTDRGLEDIANQCGFGSLSHFYLVFRKEIGVQPREISPERPPSQSAIS